MLIASNIISLVLAFIVILQIVIQHRERKDLYDRIMARGLHEYKSEGENKPVQNPMDKASKTLAKWRGEDEP